MKTPEIITTIKNQGQATVWYIQQSNWDETARDTSSNPNWTKRISDFFLDREEAYKKMEEECQSCKSEAGEYNEFWLCYCEVTQEDIEEWADYKGWEDYEAEDFSDSDLEEIIEETGRDEYDYCLESSYDYQDIQGDLLVIWNWERYIGYARNINEIRKGFFGETEKVCCKEDKVFRPQADILVKKSELEGLTASEEKELIEERLFGQDWIWTRQAEAYIKNYLNELDERVKAEQADTLIRYAANDCDSGEVEEVFGKTGSVELEAELGNFIDEFNAVEVDADGPTPEQNEQLDAVVEKYIERVNNL